jgi:hypothetical protein
MIQTLYLFNNLYPLLHIVQPSRKVKKRPQNSANTLLTDFMKFKLILLTLLTFSIRAWSQSKNDISVLYGESTTNVDIHGAIGDYGYNPKTGTLFGITYTRMVNKLFSLETGLISSDDKVQLNSDLPGTYQGNHDGEVKALSIPLMAKFTFFKYLFADGGFLFDKQTNYTNSNVVGDQSGLGGELGVGAQFTFMRLRVFVNPFVRQYNITKFNNNLLEDGVKFGLGYSF